MRKMRIYLDTSVISHLDAPDTPERMSDTIAMWELFIQSQGKHDLVISKIVLQEIAECPEPKRSYMVNQMKMQQLEVVSRTDEITALANKYIEYGVLSQKHFNDLLHIGHAVVSRCNLIASWNFKHFVNYKTMDGINAVHLLEGYEPVRIASPSMILGELGYE